MPPAHSFTLAGLFLLQGALLLALFGIIRATVNDGISNSRMPLATACVSVLALLCAIQYLASGSHLLWSAVYWALALAAAPLAAISIGRYRKRGSHDGEQFGWGHLLSREQASPRSVWNRRYLPLLALAVALGVPSMWLVQRGFALGPSNTFQQTTGLIVVYISFALVYLSIFLCLDAWIRKDHAELLEDTLSHLWTSEETYRGLVNGTHDLVALISRDGIIGYVNSTVEACLGHKQAWLIGKSFEGITEDNSLSDLRRMLASTREGTGEECSINIAHANGGTRTLHCRARLWDNVNASGPPQLLLVGRDDTDLLVARKQLEQSEEACRNTARELESQKFALDEHALVSITDVKGQIIYANARFVETSGYSEDELLGKTHRLIRSGYHPKEFFTDLWNTISDGRTWQGEIKNRAKNGSEYWVCSTIVPFEGSAGEITHYVSIRTDVTQRKIAEEAQASLEEQLAHSRKMETIGRLAGGIAHDFNNLLTPIRGYAELVLENSDPDDDLRADVGQILTASERASDLVTKLLTFSRKGNDALQNVNLNDIVGETIALIRVGSQASVKLDSQIIGDKPLQINANPTEIQQILLNLSANAHYAMRKGGGVLHVKTEEITVAPDQVAFTPKLPAGQYALLTVSDTGCGISEEHISKIVDPFYTTKPVGEGTGLGLSIIHGIVNRLKGGISIASTVGEGTTVSIAFPISNLENPIETASADPLSDAEISGRILLVDDEEQIARMTQTMLTRRGYEVLSFTSSRGALDAFHADPDAFDLVLSDYSMPDYTGLDLINEFHLIRPELPIILVSGFADSIGPDDFAEQGFAGYIQKPFTSKTLYSAVDDVITKMWKSEGRTPCRSGLGAEVFGRE